MTETGDSPARLTSAGAGSESSRSKPSGKGGRGRNVGIGAVLALAALVGLVVWLVVDPGKSSTSNRPKGKAAAAVIVSASGLKTLAGALHQPIYWLGARANTHTELTQLPRGRIYVRYLPPDAKAGDSRAFLTVGTYAMKNAYPLLLQDVHSAGVVPVPVSAGVALYHRNNPRSVYLAFPGSDYQIEVYSPNATLARRLVAANAVSSVAASGAATPAAVSVARLKTLSASLGRPIYWAGSQPGATYELTRTADGRIFVRYLPPGVAVGSRSLFLTVGTYPVQNAFAVTQRAASGSSDTTIAHLSGNGIAVYKKKGSTHVYVAYPGSNYQIEVFDPAPDRARRLVAAERISPVR